MFGIFKDYVTARVAVSDEELALIESVARPKKLRKHQYLLQAGETSHYYCFITKGLLRVYSVDDKDNEHILRFARENWWISECESLYHGKPSQFNIDAIEDSEVLLFEKSAIEMLMDRVPAFGKMVNNMMRNCSITFQHRIHESITSTSEHQYQNFVKRYPDFALRVPQGMIASYLGIKPETLSRLRGKR